MHVFSDNSIRQFIGITTNQVVCSPAPGAVSSEPVKVMAVAAVGLPCASCQWTLQMCMRENYTLLHLFLEICMHMTLHPRISISL